MRKVRISFAEVSVILLLSTLFAAAFALLGQLERSKETVVARTLEKASTLSRFALSAKHLYSVSVDGVARSYGVPFGAEGAVDALPYPYVFARDLGRDVTIDTPGVEMAIYSAYPLRTRIDAELDAFARAALDALANAPDGRFVQREEKDSGALRVRLAQPIVLSPSCLSCHTNPSVEPTHSDWAVGDVRGVQEVSILIPAAALAAPSDSAALFLLIVITCGLGMMVVLPAVRREVQARAFFRKQAHAFEEEARTDALTGLANRRSFDETLETQLARHRDEGIPLGLIALDLDRFKRINDTYGHDVGDQVLREVGRLLRDITRNSDLAARTGGEEFSVLVADVADHDLLLEIAERVRHTVAGHRFICDGMIFEMTVSVGATVSNAEDTASGLLKRADNMLYQAKAAGRDRVWSRAS